VLPSSCSIGVLCSLGPGAEAEAEEGAAAEEEVVAEVAVVDGTCPFNKGSAITKGTKNICLGVNLAMLTLQSGFDARHVRMNASA
jgi:hypothetical protein